MKTTCIMCPVGCSLEIREENGNIIVEGNACPRGELYGKDEFIAPKRVVTSIVKTKSGYVSVKTTNPVPKDKVFDVLKVIEKIEPKDVVFGSVLIKNILDFNSDIIVTGVHVNN